MKARIRIPGTEVDYWEKLSPEQRAFLQQFNDEERGYFRKDLKPLRGVAKKRAIWRDRYHSREDAFAKASGRPLQPNDVGSHTPELEEAIDAIGTDTKLSDYLGKPKP